MPAIDTFGQLRYFTGMTTAEINARTAELVSGRAAATDLLDELLLHTFAEGITSVGITGLPAPIAGWYTQRLRHEVRTPAHLSRGKQQRIAEMVTANPHTPPRFDAIDVAILTEAAEASRVSI